MQVDSSPDDLLSSMHSGLKDLGRHVVLGFTKLTGMELPDREDVHYFMQGDKSYQQQEAYGNGLDSNLVGGDEDVGYYYKEPSVRKPKTAE